MNTASIQSTQKRKPTLASRPASPLLRDDPLLGYEPYDPLEGYEPCDPYVGYEPCDPDVRFVLLLLDAEERMIIKAMQRIHNNKCMPVRM